MKHDGTLQNHVNITVSQVLSNRNAERRVRMMKPTNIIKTILKWRV